MTTALRSTDDDWLDADRRDPQGVRWSNHRPPRPYIVRPDGSEATYTRVTSFIKCLEDTSALDRWKRRIVLLGVAVDPGLFHAVAAADPEDKARLDEIADLAFEAGRGHEQARKGTDLHKLTEYAEWGDPLPEWATEADRADVDAYTATMTAHHIAILAIEQRVVVDEFRVTGTFDRLVDHDGKRRILDLKTGGVQYGRTTMAMQLAMYAHGQFYDPLSAERTDPDVDKTVGLICHLPQGQATCTLYEVDLLAGWEGVGLARQVRDWRNRPDPFTPVVQWRAAG